MQTDDIEETVRLWRELWDSEPDERLKSEYLALTRVLYAITGRPIKFGLNG